MRDGEQLSKWVAYSGRIVTLAVEEVRLPNGRIAELDVVHHPGAAAVVAVTPEDQVVLIRQYRWPTGGWLLEVPAGMLRAGEDPEACARRELEEETGLRASRLVPLGWIWTSPGFADEKIWLYLARGLEAARQALDDDEILSVEKVALTRAVDMAGSGEISDGKSVAALVRAARWLEAGTA
jgi:ADP-ribose pyrophosphatase